MATENHQLNTPPRDAQDWDVPLNENFEALDTDVEIRDANSARSTYEPKSNAKYVATDTGDIYLGDGSNWNHFGQVSDDPSFDTITQGRAASEQLTETATPDGYVFVGGTDRDYLSRVDVEVGNSTSSSATEDVTVTLYEGSDSTGTELETETQSVTVGETDSTTISALASDQNLASDTQQYFIEVTTGGSTLTIDRLDAFVEAATWTHTQTAEGDFVLEDHFGNTVMTVDAASLTTTFDDEERIDVVADGDNSQTDFTVTHSLGVTPGNVTLTPKTSASAATHYISEMDDTSVTITFASAPASGTGNIEFDLLVER